MSLNSSLTNGQILWGGVRTKIEKNLISLVIWETLAFLVFNKLNSVYEPLATSWALTTPGLAASNRKC